MKKDRRSSAVTLFTGLLLTAVFGIGLASVRNPGLFQNRYLQDTARDFFVNLCEQIWLPAGMAGIPMFLVSLILDLRRDRKERRRG